MSQHTVLLWVDDHGGSTVLRVSGPAFIDFAVRAADVKAADLLEAGVTISEGLWLWTGDVHASESIPRFGDGALRRALPSEAGPWLGHELRERRRELVLAGDDGEELAIIDAELDKLPVGDTPEDRKAWEVLHRVASRVSGRPVMDDDQADDLADRVAQRIVDSIGGVSHLRSAIRDWVWSEIADTVNR